MNKLVTVKCLNYEVCGGTSECELEDDEKIEDVRCFCENCEIHHDEWGGDSFDELKFINNINCCVCMEEDQRGVIYPKCSHYVCIKCYKEIWKSVFDPESYELEETIDMEFVEDLRTTTIKIPNNIPQKFIKGMAERMRLRGIQVEESEYDKINKYYKECLADKKRYDSRNLRRCPLCRK
jgi:hypothetical protein